MSDAIDTLFPIEDEVVDAPLLELVDHLLDKGVVLTGELMLGICEVDLVYVRLSLVLGAADRFFNDDEEP